MNKFNFIIKEVELYQKIQEICVCLRTVIVVPKIKKEKLSRKNMIQLCSLIILNISFACNSYTLHNSLHIWVIWYETRHMPMFAFIFYFISWNFFVFLLSFPFLVCIKVWYSFFFILFFIRSSFVEINHVSQSNWECTFFIYKKLK